MTPEQSRARSAEKVKQVIKMAEMLNLRVEARQRINEMGFIELVAYWIDEEVYPQPEKEEPVDIAVQPEAASLVSAELSKDGTPEPEHV